MSERRVGRGVAWACLAALCAAFVLPGAERRERKEAVQVDTVEFKGWKENLRLANGDAELIATLEVGPRLLSYRLADGTNVFNVAEGQAGKSGEEDWRGRGGHRLWTAPEDLTRTYSPDNGPVKWEKLGPGSVRLTQPDDRYGIRKEMDVTLADKGSRVTVLHRITNVGKTPTTLAPWALSVMNPGGLEIIPLPEKKPHPGSPKRAKSPADYAPNQHLVLWPYFDFRDDRWTFGSRYLTLRQDRRGPTKAGLAHRLGWVGYLNGGTLFVKRFGYTEGKTYPDRGCNFETFTNEGMLEIESLGPLAELAPGQKAEWREEWELFQGVPAVRTEEEIDKHILPLVKR